MELTEQSAGFIFTPMVVNMADLTELFARLGVSENEGKVYAALVAQQPATAYEAAKDAGVPTSKVYEVLDRLEARGMVRGFEDGGKKRYLPQPPEEFVEATRRKLGQTLDALKSDLGRLGGVRDQSLVWNLSDGASLMDKACRMVESAAETLLVSAWNPEAQVLAPLVVQARARGVKTALVHFGPGNLDLPGVFRHPIEDTIYAEKGGRGLTVVADAREALMGTLADEGGLPAVEGAWSLNRGFVTLAEDYVKHDIYIMKVVERFDAELVARFGPRYEKLRDVWNDEEA
jgi:sugar-specific transcriptional regulator TrmB